MHKRNITVMGGGHGSRTIAADMTLAGHQVTLFEFEKFHDNVASIFENGKIEITGQGRNGVAEIHKLTHDMAEALENPELVLITVPAFAHNIYAKAMAKYICDGMNIVLIPGTFGSLEFITEIRKQGCKAKNITISELDTLPYATRINGSNSVHVYHYLPNFGMGVFPSVRTEDIVDIFKDLYPGVSGYRDVLEAGLSNSNPVIHPLGVLLNTGRIEYSRGEFWYYEEGITTSTAQAMEKLDDERIALGKKFDLNLPRQSEVLYGIGYGPKGDLWEIFKGSKKLTPIKGPSVMSNRYVTEDVPIGLVCWSQLGDMLGVPTPLMKATIEIGIAISNVNYWETGRTLERCGIAGMSIKELNQLVKTGEI